jgi:hypothetical protein
LPQREEHRGQQPAENFTQSGYEARLYVAAKDGLFGQPQGRQKQQRAGFGCGDTVEQRGNFSAQENGQDYDGNSHLERRRQQRTVPAGTAHRLAAVEQSNDDQYQADTGRD